MDRPTVYTPEVAAEICSRLAEGKSLKEICENPQMPARSRVYLWLKDETSFQDMYARAREDQADTLADEIQQIADTPLLGVIRKVDAEGNVETTEEDMLGHRKLQIDARKWIAAKLKPKKYGDIKEVQLSGEVTLVEILREAAKPSAD